jgi:hypothetical protein
VVVNNTSPQLQIKSHRRAATPTYAGVAYTEPGARPEIFPDTGLTSEQLTRAVSRMTDTRN